MAPARSSELPAGASLEHALATVLASRPEVRAAWLFGSLADGSGDARSDVDVAVLGCDTSTFDERAQLSVDLAAAAARPCDVVTVEHASPVLGMEIVRADRRFFCRDATAADAWEDFALRRYLGTAYLRRLVYQNVRDDLAAGLR